MASRFRPAVGPSVQEIALVVIGGVIGAAARWGLLEATAATDDNPAGPVLLANLVGCGLLGLLLGRGVASSTRLLAGVGFCGGLTTFSTFAVEVAEALRTSDASGALGYTVLSVGGGLATFLLGRMTGRAILRGQPTEPSC